MKRLLLLSVALIGTPALAQTGPAASGPAASGTAASGTGPAASGAGVAEIIVTANRRAESVQKVANAIAVVTGDRLKESGVTSVTALEGITPGVKVQVNAAAANIYVRGVGTQGLISDPSAPLFVDGVYVGRGTATNALFFDLARVEVLKGPQGTLYGRNAVAGAINLVSTPPSDHFEGGIDAGVGSFGHWSLDGVLNLPVTDRLALRASVKRTRDDGYLSNGGNQSNDFGARLQALAHPSDTVTLRVIGDYYRQNGRGPSTLPVYAAAGTTAGACSGQRFCHPDDPWYTPEKAGHVEVRNWGLTGELSVDLGDVKLSVQPAHRNSYSHQLSYVNNNALGSTFDIDTDQNSVDAHLSSQGSGPLKWIAGGYYHEERTRLYQVIPGIFGGPGITFSAYTNVPSNAVHAASAYAEVTYAVSPRARLTGGLRYNDERRSQTGQGYVVFTAAPFPLSGQPANPYRVDGHFGDSRLTWKALAEYDLTPASMLYASASTGFKSGGINREAPVTPAGAPYDNTFRSETLTAFALGSKNRLFDNRLTLNLEAFYWRYNNRQNEQFAALNSVAAPNTARDLKTFNLGKTRIYGLEGAAQLKVGAHGLFEISGTYLNARYMNDPANNFPATTLALNPVVTLLVEPGADLRGKTLAFSPEWSGTVAYTHTFGLGEHGSLRARVESDLQTGFYAQYRLANAAYQPGYSKTSLTLTWTDASARYSVSGYVRNIENRAILRTVSATALTTSTPLYFGYIEAPRTAGVDVGIKF